MLAIETVLAASNVAATTARMTIVVVVVWFFALIILVTFKVLIELFLFFKISVYDSYALPIAIENAQAEPLSKYDKKKYKEMILDAAETILGFLDFDRTVYSSNIKKKKGRRKWYDELREERTRDIQTGTRITIRERR